MKHLSIKDIIANREKRSEKRKECFNKVIEMCYKKIEKTAKLDSIGCFFDVPEFLIGYPLFNLNECIVYVYNSLINNGFQVQYIFPRILYVTWITPQTHGLSSIQGLIAPQIGASSLSLEHHPVTPAHTQATQKNTQATKGARAATGRAASPGRGRGRAPKNQPAAKSIAEFKPSGKFVLNLS